MRGTSALPTARTMLVKSSRLEPISAASRGENNASAMRLEDPFQVAMPISESSIGLTTANSAARDSTSVFLGKYR